MVINTSRDVTPHTGVWIETLILATRALSCSVTPHTGVWIETVNGLGIDVPTFVSPPIRGCGLKHLSSSFVIC